MTVAGNQGQNLYPAPDNYPASSFPQPVPAPDFEPDDAGTLLLVQYSWEWQQVLLAAVDQLRNPATWQGDEDTVKLALNRATNLKDMLQIPVSPPEDSVPTPYWDDEDASDVDDEMPIGDQDWYGELEVVDDALTFRENAEIWVFAGLLAISGLPFAAIAFVPVAQRFVLAFKKHDLGGIVKAFIDGGKVGQVDTYSTSGGVATLDIIIPATGGFRAFDAPPTLWVELSDEVNPALVGEPQIQVIRQKLTSDDLYPPTTRYDSDCDCIQITTDGGDTWQEIDSLDPRKSPFFAKAPLGVGHACDSAANMVKWVKDFVDYELGLFEAGAAITGLANGVLFFVDLLFPAAIFAQLLIDIAGTIFTIGSIALGEAFDEATYDALLCVFYTSIDSDGTVSPEQLDLIRTRTAAQLNTTANIIMSLIYDAQGNIGVQNAGAIGGQTGDCDDCVVEWCYRFDADHRLSEWEPKIFGLDTPATWDGTQWIASGTPPNTTIWIRWELDTPIVLTDAAIIGFTPTVSAGDELDIFVNGNGSDWANGTQIWKNGFIVGSPFPVTVTSIDVSNLHGFAAVERTISALQFSGTDEINPFGEDNC